MTDIVNHPTIKAMEDEYEEACKAINDRKEEVVSQCLSDALVSLMAGDTATRDKLCAAAERAYDAADKAKVEAGLRIAERYGMSREAIEAKVASIKAMN